MMKEKQSHNALILTVAACVVLVLLCVSFLRVYFKDYELRQEIQRTQTSVDQLQKRKIESLDVLKQLQSDSYVEDRAHAELQAVRPGEQVIVVPGLSVSSTAATTVIPDETGESARALSNPATWWYYFFQLHN